MNEISFYLTILMANMNKKIAIGCCFMLYCGIYKKNYESKIEI